MPFQGFSTKSLNYKTETTITGHVRTSLKWKTPFRPAPFGRSKSSSQPKVWVSKARRLFDNHPQLVVEDMRSDYTGILVHVKHTDGARVSQRLMIKAAYPEVAAIVQKEGNRHPALMFGWRRLWRLSLWSIAICVKATIIMFGHLDPEEAEHSQVPIVRLIDPGEAKVMRPDASHLLVDEFSKNEYNILLDLARYRPLKPAQVRRVHGLINGNIETERDYDDIKGYDGLESDDTL
ncbi:hypothetical protein DL766_005900 [Monosporascus sp. MC13-8B]|uniref:Uncharacterized protein n=1 Tax=Monosporascus cannonballus TaxID=155416 RepID=A0ABY0GR79_9PEZI|nr:hypothetical protein DL762_010611 [Monosporascus cannonballus]RYO88858.1 hypothetical protein DL763_005821 [Monosporascus cannonballus]RYP28402.1 hypothetical protein DL766_005900 [Monosporascus sp. MC13-8B]